MRCTRVCSVLLLAGLSAACADAPTELTAPDEPTAFTLPLAAPSFNHIAGQPDIDEHFSSPATPGLLYSSAEWEVTGGEIVRKAGSATGGNDREYVRTAAADYLGVDFVAEVTFERTGGQIHFFGIGEGVRTVYSNEPEGAGFRFHGPSLVSGRVDVAFLTPTGALTYVTLGTLGSTPGPHLARITKTGSTTVFEVFASPSSSTPTFSHTVTDLLEKAPFLYSGNTRVYFGTSSTNDGWDDLKITDSPSAEFLDPAPISVMPGASVSTGKIQFFKEQTNALVPFPLAVDASAPGTYTAPLPVPPILPGTVVNSYLVHQDRAGGGTNSATITFDEDIVGIITSAANLDASDAMLGHPGTSYPTGVSSAFRATFDARDQVTISADRRTLSVKLSVSGSRIDQLRVLTEGELNLPPAADAGATAPSFEWVAGDNVTLDGSNSSDVDGTIISWDWAEGSTALGSGEILETSLDLGSHDITLIVTDNGGAVASTTITVNVVDTTAPVISLEGADEVTLEWGDTYADLGATAADSHDGDVAVTVDASLVDAATGLGDYIVTYTATDAAGNSSETTRTVHVVDTTAPVIVATLESVTGESLKHNKGLFTVSFSCTDSCDSDPDLNSATINGVAVTDGQIVDLRLKSEKSAKSDKSAKSGKSGKSEKPVKIEGLADELVLTVVCTDESGNTSTETVTPEFAEKSAKSNKSDKSEKSEKSAKSTKSDKSDSSKKSGNAKKGKKGKKGRKG